MNLHQIVRSAINSVNPDQPITIKMNKGNLPHEPAARITPIWEELSAMAQVQPVPSNEIQFINNYIASSTYMNFYIFDNYLGLNRRDENGNGGDVIIWNGYEWYIDSVPEPWGVTANWTKVRGVQQLPIGNDDGTN